MATGTVWQPGGVASPSDVPYAGVDEWQRNSGVSAMSPLVRGTAGRSDLPYAIDGASRVVSTGAAPAGVSGPGVELLDDWRDAFNPHSPAFWLLLMLVVMLGLMQLRVSARAGKVSAGAALG